ncbi:MAG: class I SAM-dependent methyltransferase [Bacteroidales bacterium]|nr:class I SAM-dependent methyltransferase [Bacteroidales bacterium]
MKDTDIVEANDQILFNRIARKYAEKDQYIVSSKAREFQLISLVKFIEKKLNINHFRDVLELGCGVGANSKYLKGYYDHYIGIDYSEEFIKLANNLHANNNTEFLCGNLKDYTFHKNAFDLVIGVGILHHLPNIGIVLQNLKKQFNKDVIYGFIEVQSGNPAIQLLRNLRKRTDHDYSEDQNIFSRKFIYETFQNEGFEIRGFLFQGYFTPPFAQVKLKPESIMLPLVKMAIASDRFIQSKCPNFLSWNMIFLTQIKE